MGRLLLGLNKILPVRIAATVLLSLPTLLKVLQWDLGVEYKLVGTVTLSYKRY